MRTRTAAILLVAGAMCGLACGGDETRSAADACPAPDVDAGAVDPPDATLDTSADQTEPPADALDAGTDQTASCMDGGTAPAVPCVGCTRAAIGTPTWEPTSIVLFAGRLGQFGEDYNPFMQSLLGPRHQFYSAVNQFGPAVAHQPPYDHEIYDLLAARGITPSQTFTSADFTAPSGVVMTMTIVPAAGAAVASSFDFTSGPVITNLQFPIVVDADLYRGGQLYDPRFDSLYAAYSRFSPPVTISGSNPPLPAQGASHFFMNFRENSGFVPPGPVGGDYEYRVVMIDATGAGWTVTVPFKVTGPGVTPSTGIPVVTDGDGAFPDGNAAGLVGRWWAAGDSFGEDGAPGTGSCFAAGFSAADCSVLTTPTPGMPFQPGENGKMCTSGISAKVLPGSDGMLAWSSIWGNLIGFYLNETGTGPWPGNALPYDAVAHGITGLAFDIDAVPFGGHVRVAFATTGTERDAPYWGGATGDVSPLTAPGHYEMRWPEIGGPMYLGPTAPAFDPTQLKWIHFHVVSNNLEAIPYSFCLSNVMLLTN